MSSDQNDGTKFKCGPPDGVPIWQWLPAVFCWLSSVLPPTITAGSCTPVSLAASNSPQPTIDADGNGIPDAAEYLKSGRIALETNPKRAGFRQDVTVTATLLNAAEERILVDSVNEVNFSVSRIVAYSGSVKRDVYLGEESDPRIISDYVNFSPVKIRAKEGQASLTVSTV